MSKKLTEMTNEELQDYILQLQDEARAQKQVNDELLTKNAELNELNIGLQKRNNELFLRVAQQDANAQDNGTEEPTTLSCEDFAVKNIKEIIR